MNAGCVGKTVRSLDRVQDQFPVPDIYFGNQPPKTNSAFHPSGVGKWVPASAGKAKPGMVYSVSGWTRGVQVKLWDPLRTRAIHERLKGVITTRRYKKIHVYLYLYLYDISALYESYSAMLDNEIPLRRQWRRQRSKGAALFRGQNILEPGHPDAPFPQKSWRPFLVFALKTQRSPTLLRLFHCQNKTNKAVSGQIW